MQATLQINENEVDKFYKQREQSKRFLERSNLLISRSQTVQPLPFSNQSSFKNLYRRKSLMHRLNQDQSFVNTLNNSLSVQRPLPDNLMKISLNRTSIDNTQNEQQMKLGSKDDVGFKQSFYFLINHNQLRQKHPKQFFSPDSEQVLTNQPKKRSNSFKLQNYSIASSNLRQSRRTVPLSTILKKYKQEVSKLEKEGALNQSSCLSFSKKQSINAPAFALQNNKQNFDTFNPGVNQLQQHQGQGNSPKLPESVQKCISKWKDLEIRHVKGGKIDKFEIDMPKISGNQTYLLTQKPHINFNNSKDQKEQQRQRQQNFQILEQKLRQKQQKIKQVQKQNNQYRKFVESIRKMKTTLEGYESTGNTKGLKPQDTGRIQNQKQNRIDLENITKKDNNDSEVNLKELWRWIKSLPTKKKDQ